MTSEEYNRLVYLSKSISQGAYGRMGVSAWEYAKHKIKPTGPELTPLEVAPSGPPICDNIVRHFREVYEKVHNALWRVGSQVYHFEQPLSSQSNLNNLNNLCSNNNRSSLSNLSQSLQKRHLTDPQNQYQWYQQYLQRHQIWAAATDIGLWHTL